MEWLLESVGHPLGLDDRLLEEVLGEVDLVWVPGDRDDAIVGALDRLVDRDVRPRVRADLPDSSPSFTDDSSGQIFWNSHLQQRPKQKPKQFHYCTSATTCIGLAHTAKKGVFEPTRVSTQLILIILTKQANFRVQIIDYSYPLETGLTA